MSYSKSVIYNGKTGDQLLRSIPCLRMSSLKSNVLFYKLALDSKSHTKKGIYHREDFVWALAPFSFLACGLCLEFERRHTVMTF